MKGASLRAHRLPKASKTLVFSMRGGQRAARPASFDQLFVNDIIPSFDGKFLRNGKI
jgi:hypothetical protein